LTFGAGAPETPPISVCVVMLSAIGDGVHVLPVFTAIKRAWPDTHLTWIAQPVPMEVGLHHPDVDEFIPFHRRRGMRSWTSLADLMQSVRGRKFDLVINLQVYLKAGLITALLDSPRKLGFDRARARDMNWIFTNERIPAHPVQHVEDQYFEFLRYLGIDPLPVDWQFVITEEERDAQRRFYARQDRPVCTIVLGTSRREKNWAPENYARVVDALDLEHGLQVILVGGESPVEREAAEIVVTSTRSNPLVMLKNDLRRLIWLVDGCALMVAPDTGPLHIANALGVPVVGMYGFTNPKRCGPYRKGLDLVVDGYAHFPGEEYVPSLEYRDGMRRVTVEMVLGKIQLAVERHL
jgi:heptosyltransferase I